MNQQILNFNQEQEEQYLTIDSFLLNHPERYNCKHQTKYYNKYVVEHANEFLDIALNEKDNLMSIKNNKSRKAFLLLANSPKNVMDELLIDGRFLIKSTIILSQLCIHSSYELAKELVNRVASIFINIISKTKERNIIIDSIGFLTQMIQFIEDDAVFDLFRLAASSDEEFKEMQIYLSQINLSEFLLNELSKRDKMNSKKEINICIFIKDCLQNLNLQKAFQKEEILIEFIDMFEQRKNDILMPPKLHEYGDSNIRVINEISEALQFLVCPKLATQMKPLLSLSVEIIKSFKDSLNSISNEVSQKVDYWSHKIIRKYHICLFDIVSKIIITNSKILDNESQEILIESIEKVIQIFPNSTNLITAAFRVVKSSMILREFAKKIVHSLMPVFLSLAKSKIKNAASAAATHFLADMENTKKSSKMVSDFLTKNDQYMSFYDLSFKKYLEEAYTPYGGPVVKFYDIEKVKTSKKDVENGSKSSFVT